jgi:hypothetical protein
MRLTRRWTPTLHVGQLSVNETAAERAKQEGSEIERLFKQCVRT